jgi:putative lysine transport system permease protein
MTKLIDLIQDMARLWEKYQSLYLNGIFNTLVLALVATVIGCVIGLICGILNTIPYTPQDNIVKRFVLRLTRIIVRVYVEVFRGTPMVLQAVFIYYGLPYFSDNALRFDSVWAAAILIVSINTGA